MWITIILAVIMISYILTLTERYGYYRQKYSLSESLLYFAGLTFQHDVGGTNPENVSSRLIAIITAMTLIIIMSTYLAVLTANTVTLNIEMPVTGFKDPKVIFLFTSSNMYFSFIRIISALTWILLNNPSIPIYFTDT